MQYSIPVVAELEMQAFDVLGRAPIAAYRAYPTAEKDGGRDRMTGAMRELDHHAAGHRNRDPPRNSALRCARCRAAGTFARKTRISWPRRVSDRLAGQRLDAHPGLGNASALALELLALVGAKPRRTPRTRRTPRCAT
jgi:hypothetical protein